MPSCKKLLLLLLFIPYPLISQVFPKEDSKLNYRLIGFSFLQMNDAGKCTIEIAKGNCKTADVFKKNIIISADSKKGNAIAEVPAFGSDYTWAVLYGGKLSAKNELHHFSTLMSPRVDTTLKRLRVAKEATQYKDAYVFLDCLRVLYDMKGNPVWFLPDSNFAISEGVNVRDLKLSPKSTITFLTDNEVYETNYDGGILWKGPNTGAVSGQPTELYHHEFTRLANGHYMALGVENPLWSIPATSNADSAENENEIIAGKDGTFYQKMTFGTVIEYDETGKVVWYWKSSEYFRNTDLYKHALLNGQYDIKDVHENSFYFDEQADVIYVSFRNISRIVKIKYPEGTELAAYGNGYQQDMEGKGNDLFCGQHSVGKTSDGYLYLFNNNALVQDDFPKLLIMAEPKDSSHELKKVWEYTCTLDGMSEREQKSYHNYKDRRLGVLAKRKSRLAKMRLTSGGSVIELPDKSLFSSMNGPFSKTFIVTRDKEIMWSAIPEQRASRDSAWRALPDYKASIIVNTRDMEQLIWNRETK